jgi:LysR family transcriptional regulator, nod-box dependent transcriptional activator
MRFHGLDLNLLVALDALLTHQNVTRAAEQLNLSQSALSGALARLREHFDDELVVPIGRRMEPTPLARTLAEPLHEILLKTKSLVTATPTFDPQTSNRRISIIASDYSTEVFLLDLLTDIAREAPGVKIHTGACRTSCAIRAARCKRHSSSSFLIKPASRATFRSPCPHLRWSHAW